MQHPLPQRGDIYFADMNASLGSEQAGIRPVLIIQNDIGNGVGPTTIVAAITSRIKSRHLPTHVKLPRGALAQDAIVMLEQIRTIDKRRLCRHITTMDKGFMQQIDCALIVSLNLSADAIAYRFAQTKINAHS